MSQRQPVIITGLKMSKGEFTPENGMNKGVPQLYDNLNIYTSKPFDPSNMEAVGAMEQIFKLKGSGNYYRFNKESFPLEAELEFEFDFTKTPPKPILKDIHIIKSTLSKS